MGYQSKTYSLSDEVVAAIDAARSQGLSPNRYLRHLMGIEPLVASSSETTPFTAVRKADDPAAHELVMELDRDSEK